MKLFLNHLSKSPVGTLNLSDEVAVMDFIADAVLEKGTFATLITCVYKLNEIKFLFHSMMGKVTYRLGVSV